MKNERPNKKPSKTITQIFGHAVNNWDRELCLRILHLYRQFPAKSEQTTELLVRLQKLEVQLESPERRSIAEILQRNVEPKEITKRLIAKGWGSKGEAKVSAKAVNGDEDEEYKEDEEKDEGKDEEKDEEKEDEDEENINQLKCEVCMTTLPRSAFPSHKIMPDCTHQANLCLDCLTKSISVQSQGTLFDRIICPASGCTQRLDNSAMQMFASPATWSRYMQLTIRRTQERDPNFVWCQNPSCSEGQLNYGRVARVVCLYCKYETCSRHNTPWHDRKMCEEIPSQPRTQQHIEDDMASQLTLNRETKCCPRCGIHIVKTAGCDKIVCDVCNLKFKWSTTASSEDYIGP